jgi:hypothetical protein
VRDRNPAEFGAHRAPEACLNLKRQAHGAVLHDVSAAAKKGSSRAVEMGPVSGLRCALW